MGWWLGWQEPGSSAEARSLQKGALCLGEPAQCCRRRQGQTRARNRARCAPPGRTAAGENRGLSD